MDENEKPDGVAKTKKKSVLIVENVSSIFFIVCFGKAVFL